MSGGAEPDAAPAVRARGLRKSFRSAAGSVEALRGIDLDVPAGQLTMLVGPSGCGKTTLISVVAGILAPDAGRCFVLGVDVAELAPGARLDFRARHVGFIFQQFHLLPSLIVADNVAVPLIINGMGRRPAQERARAVLDQVGLADRWQEAPAVLSGGEQQRVAIARALVHAPDLIVCDEPTSALDHDTGQRIMELMKGLVRSRGMTVLIVTHDSRIFTYADRIAHMDDGRVTAVEADGAAGAAAGGAG